MPNAGRTSLLCELARADYRGLTCLPAVSGTFPSPKKSCYTRQVAPSLPPNKNSVVSCTSWHHVSIIIVLSPLNTTLHKCQPNNQRGTSCRTNVCYLLLYLDHPCVSYACKLASIVLKPPWLRNWNLWTMPWATRRTASKIIVKRCMRPRATRVKKRGRQGIGNWHFVGEYWLVVWSSMFKDV